MFSGQLVTTQHCKTCSQPSVTTQPFLTLPLPVEDTKGQGQIHIQDCFAKYASVEKLTRANGIICEACSRNPKLALGQSSSRMPSMVLSMSARSNTVFKYQGVYTSSVTRPKSSGILLNQLQNGGSKSGYHGYSTAGVQDSQDSAFGSLLQGSGYAGIMSPIRRNPGSPAMNDSGFPQVRTSTPISGLPGQSPASSTREEQHPTPLTVVSEGRRQTLLRQPPDCLIAQLMRFTYNNGQLQKIRLPIRIQPSNLDLSHLILDNALSKEKVSHPMKKCFQYNLYAMCVHLGDTRGHYIAYAQVSDRWFKFDDASVTQVNIDYEVSTKTVRENAYLLFYRRVVLP